jgi:hypothetical protein
MLGNAFDLHRDAAQGFPFLWMYPLVFGLIHVRCRAPRDALG